MDNKVQTAIKVSLIAIVMVLTSGCVGIWNRLDQLETKVGLLEQEIASADAAQATADEALAAAAENAACCDATNEKIGRMFQRSQSK